MSNKDFSTKMSYRYQKVGRKIQFIQKSNRYTSGRYLYVARLLWMALLEHVDDNGRCNPSYPALMAYAGVGSKSTVKHAINMFIEIGLLSYAAGGKGLKDSNVYQLNLPKMEETVIAQGRYPDPLSMKLARPESVQFESVQSENSSVQFEPSKRTVSDPLAYSLSEKYPSDCTGTILNHKKEPQNEPQAPSVFLGGLDKGSCLAVKGNGTLTATNDQPALPAPVPTNAPVLPQRVKLADGKYDYTALTPTQVMANFARPASPSPAPISTPSPAPDEVEAIVASFRKMDVDERTEKANDFYDELVMQGASASTLSLVAPLFQEEFQLLESEIGYNEELGAQPSQIPSTPQSERITQGNGHSGSFTASLDSLIHAAAFRAEEITNPKLVDIDTFADFYRKAVVFRPLERAERSTANRIRATQAGKIVRRAGTKPNSVVNRMFLPEDLDDLLKEFEYEWQVLGKPEIEPLALEVGAY